MSETSSLAWPYHGGKIQLKWHGMNPRDRDPGQNPSLPGRLQRGIRILLGAVRPPGQYGISHPKSGRTWLRAMVGRVLCGRTGMPESELLNTRSLTAAAGLPVLKWHHGGASLKSPCQRHDELRFDERFAGKSTIFVIRDPRDTLVSSYFQAVKRWESITGSVGEIGEFIRSSERGILKWIAFHNLWHDNLVRLASFHLVRYEAMHADPLTTLRGVLEASGRLRDAALNPKDASDPNSFKVRKGQVGGYRETLSEGDLAFIEGTLNRYPCPLYTENYLRT